MKILVIGSGGREHSIIWKLKQNKKVEKIFCVPGNGGISQDAECISDIQVNDYKKLVELVKENKIDITIVGPEMPLVDGIVNYFNLHNLKIFGPDKKSSLLEGSKIFAKNFMKKYNIPTPEFVDFDNSKQAIEFVKKNPVYRVVKADGLCAGKGVFVCDTLEQTIDAIKECIDNKIFSTAGEKILIEKKYVGKEVSILCFCDGENILPLFPAKDHKRVYDGDKGPNTGGMGAYSPVEFLSYETIQLIEKNIIRNFIKGVKSEKLNYKGVIYFGLIISENKPYVLEFNVRFGDPETQAILPRLTDDLLEVMLATSYGCLLKIKKLNWLNKVSVCVVCASGGYPKSYQKGKEIFGLDEVEKLKDIVVFHAGTKKIDNKFITDGGRVLNIVGLADTINLAIDKTYEAVKKIYFEGIHYRKDIGKKALKILNA